MKIGIDARILINAGNYGGIGRYLSNLILHLAEVDKENQYFLFFNFFKSRHAIAVRVFLKNNMRAKTCRVPPQIMNRLFDWFTFPIEACIGRVDVFHDPDFSLLPQRYGRAVVTIHDLMYLHYPQLYPKSWNEHYRRVVSRALKRADVVITVSEFVKQDIVKKFNYPEGKIKVVYNGIGEHFKPAHNEEKRDTLKRRYGIKGQYLLYVGLLEPQKNILRLLEAFYGFSQMQPAKYKLVIAGKGSYGFYNQQIQAKIKELGLNDKVILTGFLHDEDLPGLYSLAELFVFPSLFEGFGIPPVEAMASGVPVITSQAASLPEIVGGAAVLVDPMNVSEISQAMSNVVQDRELRLRLIEKGFERAKQFSWSKTALDTLKIYKGLEG